MRVKCKGDMARAKRVMLLDVSNERTAVNGKVWELEMRGVRDYYVAAFAVTQKAPAETLEVVPVVEPVTKTQQARPSKLSATDQKIVKNVVDRLLKGGIWK